MKLNNVDYKSVEIAISSDEADLLAEQLGPGCSNEIGFELFMLPEDWREARDNHNLRLTGEIL